ncbi:uncharacterized protein LTR77_007735 [Saxophila tyrrhenica]|uniref:Glutamate carboxypeptidase n=1 Tax=Saxophila tyrrhenica TaxID=1690608 RepID=A0AAV9P2X1_9PEZI|nr:hypothetical protein LTR77_007735 [Saxophila tyrrhenica]
MVKSLLIAGLLATGLEACQRKRTFNHHDGKAKRTLTPRAPLSADESLIISSFDANSIDDWSYYYTHGLHLAGTNRSQAQWTADRWSEAGFNTRLDTYNVFLDYPINKSMVMTYGNGSVYRPSLEEDVLPEDPTTGYPNRTPTFHGYSASGAASGKLVYVGLGQQDDFQRLIDLGVPLEGNIAIARYGGPFRGLKVKNSQAHGMLGCIIFTDPDDDGNITVANGYAAYPDGPARNPTSVQRGSVQFLSTYPGDPTTPGYPSIDNPVRADRSSVVPQIPSIPLSYQDAQPILQAMDGFGTPGKQVGRENWVGALNASYSTGPSDATIDMSNYMRDTYTDLWNAIGVINGTNADETIVIGNHRDAWIVGGAADPNSGTAIIVELGKVMGRLMQNGWQPKRNIVLCSWDGEEYGLVGSTEWVEQYIPWLTGTAMTYLNIDVGASGPHPSISATPELHQVAVEQMHKVMWESLRGNRTMYDVWLEDTEGEVGVLGSGSDYTAFLHKGMASMDMGSDGDVDAGDPIYHYHSNYDSYHWMANFGDPGFLTHKNMGQYLGLVAYHLISEEFVPLHPLNYATQMDLYYQDLRDVIGNASQDVDTSELRDAIDTFRSQAEQAQALVQQAMSSGDADLTKVVNDKYRDFQRGFTSQGGLPNREFYQHVVFAPGLDTGYAPVTFPGITESVEAGNFTLAEDWVGRTSRAIRVAGNILKT